jgi:outer membrane lipoprotein-sorting protein
MRKNWIVLTLACLFFVMYSPIVRAQYDPKAKEVLDAISQNYQAMQAFKIDFTYTLKGEGINESLQGNIVIKAKRFRLALPSQEIINNGATVWTYLKDDNEVNISNYEPEPDEITPSNIYTIYQKGFKYSLVGEENIGGKIYHVIELIPENINAQYTKIRLKATKDTRIIMQWELFERNANRYTYSVTKFAKVTVGDSYFEFNKANYPGVRVEDLR